jgi:hypothetical protein
MVVVVGTIKDSSGEKYAVLHRIRHAVDYRQSLTKGIENGATRSRSFREIARHTNGKAVFARRESAQTALNLDHSIGLRQRQVAEDVVVVTVGDLADGLARSRHDAGWLWVAL